VTNTNNGVLEPTVAIWNNDFESRSEGECSAGAGLTDSHQWVWPGFNSCPEGRYMTPTRLEGYADNIEGCPSFCASGKYSGTGTAFRIACAHTCDAGAYCPAGSVTPYPCPGGTYGTEEGQFLVTSCSNCLAGFYNNGLLPATSCKSCPAGYANALAASSYCLPCIPGKYQDLNVGSILACKPCLAGKSQYRTSGNACVDCFVGKYSVQTSQSTCSTCIPGMFQNEVGRCLNFLFLWKFIFNIMLLPRY